MSGERSQMPKYDLPGGILGLSGPVEKPAPGTLPLRGDLAHIALAGCHLAAHYVIPHIQTIGDAPVELWLLPNKDCQTVFTAPPGSSLEVLDTEGEWVWACAGPDGPSGYCPAASLAPANSAL